jgi:Uma2 family endonuclease
MVITLAAPVIVEGDDALLRLSRDNPGYRIEREEDGTITMSPTYTEGGAKSGEALVQLYTYAKRAGGKAFDSNTGFNVGPGKKTMSPDASWVSRSRIDELTKLGKANKFWPISPDVVIEVKSDTDNFDDTVAHAEHFRKRGTSYAVAIDPETREVVELGTAPEGLALDFDAIVDA